MASGVRQLQSGTGPIFFLFSAVLFSFMVSHCGIWRTYSIIFFSVLFDSTFRSVHSPFVAVLACGNSSYP
ncbi:hypothetical protein BO83DRAFT_232081 [Aspergillus eucalypticola CBS 122712]|uniref:Uncharacterized protein n=1 Tax=Aspergillus eucalypticola (strain CBS 122712 / IBT 29274) TaxID=1448314 RepID=A0A317VUJ8_ASPEC|nr:uncharacterized protein BO83DRAFT_232081 [Aspergillus eucalypticola CBS 122712]PWY76528.1 hypothetical protein BO83DRAFT_232081 [Aspergillus eucalypticola CBS 122712]